MQFNELIQELKQLNFESWRKETGDYFEAVVLKSGLPGLAGRLNNWFGQPVFPAKTKLPSSIEKITNEFGGIRPGQTLYLWQEGKDLILAMLWPWQDKEHTTVKIAKK